MNHKVLLADDSLTIQKVIKITLANQPFDIVDCISDDELFKKLPVVQPELVFLDFNLSEKYSGYELCSKIKALVPSARVLLLLGTFDTIDEAAMEKCGASDKIVKPFDSNKFIAICKRLVDTAPLEELTFPETKKEEFIVPQEHEEDQWKVSHTIEQAAAPEQPKTAFDVRNHLNPLDQEVSDWGMSIPGVINDEASHEKKIDLPGVIGAVKSLNEHKIKVEAKAQTPAPAKDAIKFPENDDLDYPTIEELSPSNGPVVEAKPAPKSKLISIESFNQEPEIEFQIEHSINSMDESDVSSIEAQIRDEVEEDLWKVDEFEDLKKEVAAKIEEVKNTFPPSSKEFDENLFKPLDEHEEIQWNTSDTISFESYDEPVAKTSPSASVSHDVNMQELRAEMEEMIKKHVKEYMDEMFQQKVEKISWEVIPDLAENLIRQEMAKISNKILNESN
jgi:DNA-binding response OmpR family regulator